MKAFALGTLVGVWLFPLIVEGVTQAMAPPPVITECWWQMDENSHWVQMRRERVDYLAKRFAWQEGVERTLPMGMELCE